MALRARTSAPAQPRYCTWVKRSLQILSISRGSRPSKLGAKSERITARSLAQAGKVSPTPYIPSLVWMRTQSQLTVPAWTSVLSFSVMVSTFVILMQAKATPFVFLEAADPPRRLVLAAHTGQRDEGNHSDTQVRWKGRTSVRPCRPSY